ncbi:hypothetical protein A2755_00130 [Candidatus Wolfebacteria bacterium RIFCSPHIGHO2_01_FULL_48_22]|uniref:Uncharacterized protein n=1 Tax=Candidatus Wolfebacteria bacterium RIFCSPHIGHO2_01_FULL_48_22 TaxID=1802555 RepID=A0A1F8DSD5_9BACT|nr:MAG: hypothetical protein A2755_00130 [Candidatus Wolfebacteria bacterium RIFCSPHIGHO2_01_FULL_48_22]
MAPVHYVPESPDNQAVRDLRDEVKKLNETTKKANARTERFSLILVLVALLQFLVAWFQLIASVGEMKNQWLGIAILVGAGTLLVWTVRSVEKKAE